jgi:hypothetical protein
MKFDRQVNFVTSTYGTGYWSIVAKTVCINRVAVASVSDSDNGEYEYGELRAYFDESEWDVEYDGLIYSDQAWLKSFRSCMASLGFSVQALADIGYTEQGMQGEDYVSLDVGPDFLTQCTPLYRFIFTKEAVNNQS